MQEVIEFLEINWSYIIFEYLPTDRYYLSFDGFFIPISIISLDFLGLKPKVSTRSLGFGVGGSVFEGELLPGFGSFVFPIVFYAPYIIIVLKL